MSPGTLTLLQSVCPLILDWSLPTIIFLWAVNFFADPWAVKELLVKDDLVHWHGLPLERFILLPLDITTPHELPFPYYQQHVDPFFESSTSPSINSAKPPLTHFTSSFLERTRETMLKYGNDAMELHDITAVWCAIENPPAAEETEDGVPLLKGGWKAARRIFDVERYANLQWKFCLLM